MISYSKFHSDCAEVQEYFVHIQTAETNIRSAISSLQTLRTQTSDSTILTYVANLETFLSAKLLTIEATLTHLESKCGVTRPAITSTVSIIKTSTREETTTKIPTTQGAITSEQTTTAGETTREETTSKIPTTQGAVTTFRTQQDTTSNQIHTTSTIQSTTPPSLGGCSNIQSS